MVIFILNCLLTANGANIEDYVNKAIEAADSGRIDRLSGMVTDSVRLFSATNDSMVSTGMLFFHSRLFLWLCYILTYEEGELPPPNLDAIDRTIIIR